MSVLTTHRRRPSWGRTALVTVTASLLLATACAPGGTDDDKTDGSAATNADVDNDARDMLPADIRDSGKLVVAVTPTYPPFEYLDDDGTTVIGLNAEVMGQAAQRLGLEVEYQKVAQFAAVLTGIQADRFAAGIIFSDTTEREAVVDILSYYQDGVAVVGAADGPQGNDSACGKTVGIATGSLADVLQDQLNDEMCAGKEPMKYVASANSDLQFTALDSGRVDFILTSYGVGESLAKQSDDKYAPLGDPVFPVPTGIAINKDQTGLANALQAVISDMKDDGTLDQIFDKWTTSDAIADVGINVVGAK